MRKIFSVAINKYPNPENNLRGCVNDQILLFETLDKFNLKFKEETFNNEKGTREAMTYSLNEALGAWNKDKVRSIIQYSGHGTRVVDRDGDELDMYDEALYLYDGVFLDDELFRLINKFPKEAGLIILLDSCHSGNMLKGDQKAKFIPILNKESFFKRKLKRRSLLRDENINAVLLSGCMEDQTSADASFGGKFNGAFTYYAMKTYNPKLTIKDWYNAMKSYLPSRRFTQSPQLEGSKEIYKNKIEF